MTYLSDFIKDNSESKIRSRANNVYVENIVFSTGDNDVVSKVIGTQGDIYWVYYYGLKRGNTLATCSCPYNWEGFCKHIVAVGTEIDNRLNRSNNRLHKPKDRYVALPKKEISKIYSPFDAIILPFEKEFTEDLLYTHCKYNSPTRNRYYNSSPIEIISRTEDSIHYLHEYFGDEHLLNLYKKDDTVELDCSCNGTNQFLCIHQVDVIQDLINNNPSPFYAPAEIIELKESFLNEYGFTLEDKSYEKYFEFDYIDYDFSLINKVPGIRKIADEENDRFMLGHGFSQDVSDKLELPASNHRPLEEKRGLAIVMEFNSHDIMPYVIPITGKLNKSQTEISSKIVELQSHAYLGYKEILNKKDYSIVEKALDLSPEICNSIDRDNYGLEKYFISNLRELITSIDDTLTYELTGDRNRLIKKYLKPITLSVDTVDLSFKLVEEDVFYVLKSYVHIGEKKHELINKNLGKYFFFAKDGDTFYLNKSLYHSQVFALFRKTPEVRIRKSDFEQFRYDFIQPLSRKYKVDLDILKFKSKKLNKKYFKKQVYISELDGLILFRPMLEYKKRLIEILSLEEVLEVNSKGVTSRFQRDDDYESTFLEMFQSLHPKFASSNQSFFFLSKDEFINNMWFIKAFDELNKNDIEVFGLDKLTDFKYNTNKPSLSMSVNSGIDWFDVNVEIKFGKELISLKDVRKSIINKSQYVQLKDGTIGILPEEWIKKYTHLFRSGDVKNDHIKVSKYQFSVIESLYADLDQKLDFVQSHLAIKTRLKSFNEISKVKKPRGVKAKLRDYQKEGINWLNFLDEFGFGGCLADDMGLGKTLQILSFLQHLKNSKKKINPHLVIVPTSLIFNWQDEVAKFCPTLKVLAHVGGDRIKDTKIFKKYDVILSTYGTVTNDIEYLKEYLFEYVVLDESQAIKNPNSKRFKALRLLQANNKLVMTGTPIENNTFDLYSQLTFCNPGLLGSMAHFKKEFSTPIDKKKDPEVAKELSNLINPFILRRTKEQVATELPPKTEQVLYCTMEKEQQQLYDAYRNKYRDYLLKKIDDDGLGKSKMYVLEGLTKLRQICDSPQLINDEESYTHESIKIKELIRQITEKTGSHKILVFSQFVKMLGLIKTRLDDEGVEYEYLDGRTRDRQSKVENFQNNDEVRVFLISLKAGGTGLNLTAADYVYLVDPWWNPAVEAQAIDRCYRIGQDKPVMAYKMICKGTIEEKIVSHQLRKKKLSSDIIQTDESFVKGLSKENIEELFS